jgi:hypothetical protein
MISFSRVSFLVFMDVGNDSRMKWFCWYYTKLRRKLTLVWQLGVTTLSNLVLVRLVIVGASNFAISL